MNIQHILFGLFVIIQLVISSYEAPLDQNNTNITTPNGVTDVVTTLITSTVAPIATSTALTAESTTTESVTSSETIIASTTTTTTTTVTTTAASITTPSTTNSAITSTPTTMISPTTKAPGRKFDMSSFIGGIILTIGLSAIIFLIVSYLRRHNRLPYANLR
ncbi:unnamed protein product [Rotaria sordida]|uniref:Uncharacterized protein n=1 Tax=Rotaria sordida TaxID=392033 RepID=A0A814YI58_9BILA|nr:unnamed protein product [Rotaria sordida]CAF1513017.1 unnamed protein product [Rotaria sordida]